ncbi:adhesion G-protein coupled receptor G6-like isoform 13-T13 [Salvelinus alpinus]
MESYVRGGWWRWKFRNVLPVALLWMSLQRQVAVPLRDQKVMLPNGNGKVVKVSNSVTIPTLQQFTVCFEVARSNQKNKETIFSYTRQEDSSGDEALSFGMNQDGMALVMSNETCMVDSILNPSDFTSTMKPFCLTWASTTGKVTLYYNRNSLTKTCSNTNGRLVGAGGLFRLGGKNSFDGTIYNFRLWDNAMSLTQLANLTCDAVGNIIDWDNSFWDIPSLLAQTDRTLSCSTSVPTSCSSPGLDCPATLTPTSSSIITTNMISTNSTTHVLSATTSSATTTSMPLTTSSTTVQTTTPPTTAATTNVPTLPSTTTAAATNTTLFYSTTNAPTASATTIVSNPATTNSPTTNNTVHEGLFYRISFLVNDKEAEVRESDVEKTVAQWLNQTFQNWTDMVYVANVSVQPSSDLQLESKRYTCQALLVYKTTTNVTLVEAAIFTRLGRSVAVQSVENCTRETPLHYIWPESRPTVTQYIPCFPNKDQTASRTCEISPLNYTAFWGAPDLRNCIDIGTIKVSAENAAEVAVQLDDITNNELSTDEVFKVARKVNELVKVAKINTPLAKTVVSILSNVMTSSVSALTAASECTLKTVDELVQKIEFDGPTENITSKNLALGISALNYSKFNGTSFSAFIHPNTTDLQVSFRSDQLNPLAQVTLPATLLNNLTLTNAEIAAVSRINFMFFRKTGLFQDEQDGLSLNSYVVASSVGNYSISNLQDPVEIEIVHLNYQTKPEPTCMFWDFTMKNGTGGWNSKGCRVSPMSNRNKTICLCDHLTHFGILMDISGSAVQIDEKNTKILTFITYIGCGISAIFSAATLLTYIAFEKLRRDYPSKILMNLSTSLLFLNMVFLLDGWLASFDVEGLCVAVAIFLHFFLLTSFTWMGLESIHMYIALVKVFNTYIRRYILKFCIVGWGLPAAIVAIVVAFDKNSYGKIQYGKGETGQGSSEFCWIRSQVVFYVTCVGYFSVLFLLNVAMFIVVMIQICGRNGKRSNHTLREEMLRNLRSVISLTFLLGMTWGFAFFAWGPVNLAFMYLFSIFNSLQGLFIFIFHCALKENVQKQWRRYLCFGRFRLSDNSDWSKTATNNTKKASSDTVRKSLSSSSFGSSTANWTSKAKATLNPFAKRSRNADVAHQ